MKVTRDSGPLPYDGKRKRKVKWLLPKNGAPKLQKLCFIGNAWQHNMPILSPKWIKWAPCLQEIHFGDSHYHLESSKWEKE